MLRMPLISKNKEGYTGDQVCTVYGEILEQGKVIPKLAHNYEDRKCIVCGTADLSYKPAGPDDGDTDSLQTGDSRNVTLWRVLLLAVLETIEIVKKAYKATE